MNILQKLFRRRNHWSRRDWTVLGAGLGLFGVLSLGNMGRWSIWFDEAFGIYLIRHSFLDIAKYTSTDVHPPLYYWTLKIWQGIFGSSEIALRSLSMVFMMVAIVFVYLLVRRAFSVRVGAWVVGLLALSPMMVRYSEEARMYGMAMAIVAAATYLLVDLANRPTKRKWVLYGILVSLGMWTHYYTAIAWMAHWVWRYMTVRSKNARETRKAFWTKPWVWAHTLAVGLFLPWVPSLVRQVVGVQGGGFWILPITADTPLSFLTSLILYRDTTEAKSWLAALMIAVSIIVVIVIAMALRDLRGERRKILQLCLVMALVPTVLLLGLSLPPLQPSFVDRYLLPSVPFWFAAIGISLATVLAKRRARIVLPVTAAIFLALSLGVAHVYAIGNYNKHANDPLPIKQTVQAMQHQGATGEPILSSSSWHFYEMHYYDTTRNPVYFEATDGLIWGSYDMLRYDPYRKVYNTPEFAREHGGTIWYVGDWAAGKYSLPKDGQWDVLQEVKVPGIADDQVTIRAIEIRLKN